MHESGRWGLRDDDDDGNGMMFLSASVFSGVDPIGKIRFLLAPMFR